MSDKIQNLTDTTFAAEVLASPVPVLVDYWAEWCTPCRMIAPVVDEAAERYAGRVTVAKVNVDEHPGLASRYHVRSIPTLMLFRGGQPVTSHVGGLDRSTLAGLIDAHLQS